jgi:hypothetical protein
MHWLWRGAIAIGVGGAYARVMASEGGRVRLFHEGIASAVLDFLTPHIGTDWAGRAATFTYILPVAVFVLAAYTLLTRYVGSKHKDFEPRCPKCGCILRGLTEARCPDCGEGIHA